MPVARPAAGWAFVLLAAAVGLVHAAASLSWALGSTWLLETVGDAAPAALAATGVPVGLVLAVVAVGKACAAVIPVLVHRGLLPARRAWRAASWVGAAGLVLYGTANAVVAGVVLAGIVVPEGGFDHAAMVGHAFLWDPLFAIWGVLLASSLWRSRRAAAR